MVVAVPNEPPPAALTTYSTNNTQFPSSNMITSFCGYSSVSEA